MADADGPVGALAFAAWRVAGALAEPVAPLLLARRGRRGKEDPARVAERLGSPSRPRPHGPLAWVHAASVGEANAALPLLERLADGGLSVLLTTGTVTSAEAVARRLPSRAAHQFAPLDLPGCVARFLGHWRPDLALFVESELWPGTVEELSRRGVPLALVNARMSERSYVRWRCAAPLARAVTGRVALCLAQSQADADRFARLGARAVAVTGNCKFDAPPPAADAAVLAEVRRAIGARPVWLAASTHEGEEQVALAAHARLLAEMPDLLAIVAPRHPERGREIALLGQRAGLGVSRRAAGEAPTPGTGFYVADTIGEMGVWLRVAALAFLGGSLVARGGQNPIEAALLDVPVLHGPHVANFADVFGPLDRAGASGVVTDAASLAGAAARLLADGRERADRASAARAIVERRRGALDRTLAALDPWLAPLASPLLDAARA